MTDITDTTGGSRVSGDGRDGPSGRTTCPEFSSQHPKRDAGEDAAGAADTAVLRSKDPGIGDRGVDSSVNQSVFRPLIAGQLSAALTAAQPCATAE
jgi:hypothetical protein